MNTKRSEPQGRKSKRRTKSDRKRKQSLTKSLQPLSKSQNQNKKKSISTEPMLLSANPTDQKSPKNQNLEKRLPESETETETENYEIQISSVDSHLTQSQSEDNFTDRLETKNKKNTNIQNEDQRILTPIDQNVTQKANFIKNSKSQNHQTNNKLVQLILDGIALVSKKFLFSAKQKFKKALRTLE